MPKLEYPTDDEIEAMDIRWDHGCRDGSTMTASVEVDNNYGKRKVLVAWAKRFEFAAYILGTSSTYVDDDGYMQVSRLLPATFPGRDWLIATKIPDMRGHLQNDHDEENDVVVYQDAVVEVLYEQAPYKLKEDAFTTEELDRYVESPAGTPEVIVDSLSLPGAAFKYTADPEDEVRFGGPINGTVIPFGISKVIGQEHFSVVWHRLPFNDIWGPQCPFYQRLFGTGEGDQVPWIGAINTVEFFGRNVGTVALLGVKPHRRKGIEGEFELDCEMLFGVKHTGWNWVYGHTVSGTETVNGWYLATANSEFKTADEIEDFKGLYCARDLNHVFRVGEIPAQAAPCQLAQCHSGAVILGPGWRDAPALTDKTASPNRWPHQTPPILFLIHFGAAR